MQYNSPAFVRNLLNQNPYQAHILLGLWMASVCLNNKTWYPRYWMISKPTTWSVVIFHVVILHFCGRAKLFAFVGLMFSCRPSVGWGHVAFAGDDIRHASRIATADEAVTQCRIVVDTTRLTWRADDDMDILCFGWLCRIELEEDQLPEWRKR